MSEIKYEIVNCPTPSLREASPKGTPKSPSPFGYFAGTMSDIGTLNNHQASTSRICPCGIQSSWIL